VGSVPAQGLEVGVEEPHDPTAEILRLRLDRGALATSSVTLRSWGPGLHHLIISAAIWTGGRMPMDGMRAATKSTWVTRRVPSDFSLQWRPLQQPKVGDLLLCELIAPSLHSRVETSGGGRSKLYPGDRVVCAMGNRYATSLLEGVAEVEGDRADLLSASGVCGRVVQLCEKTARPTTLRVLGQAFGPDGPVNLRDFAMPIGPSPSPRPDVVLVVGSAMDSGKTTACAAIINGLRSAGVRVGAAKLTGTASARDFGSYRDAGADPVCDFLDAGWPSTAGCSTDQLARVVDLLLGHAAARRIGTVVVEIADGLLQGETSALLGHLLTGSHHIRVVFTARESLAAVAGVERLRRLGYDVAAVGGIVTNSPLARREVELASGVPCVPTARLGGAILAMEDGRNRAVRTQVLDPVA
jgi:hypothetical protein